MTTSRHGYFRTTRAPSRSRRRRRRTRWRTPPLMRAVEREARRLGLEPESFLRSAVAMSRQLRALMPKDATLPKELPSWLESPWMGAVLTAIVPTLVQALQSGDIDALLKVFGRGAGDPAPQPGTPNDTRPGQAPEPASPVAPSPNTSPPGTVPGTPVRPRQDSAYTLPVDWDWF